MSLSVGDRLEILNLASRYNHAVDAGDVAGAAALFTEDGVIEATATGPIEGRPAIADYLSSRRGWELRRHLNSSAVIDGAGDAATLDLYLMVLSRRETIQPRLVGRYEDELRRTDGDWRFVRRRIVVDADGHGRRNEA